MDMYIFLIRKQRFSYLSICPELDDEDSLTHESCGNADMSQLDNISIEIPFKKFDTYTIL